MLHTCRQLAASCKSLQLAIRHTRAKLKPRLSSAEISSTFAIGGRNMHSDIVANCLRGRHKTVPLTSQHQPTSSANIGRLRMQTQRCFSVSSRHNTDNQQPPPSSSSEKPVPLPVLMDSPHIYLPNVFKGIRNWITATFIIAPYLEKEFSIANFLVGARQAVLYVSSCLAQGNVDGLRSVLSHEAYVQVQRNFERFTPAQREELNFNDKDIYYSFVYQIGIMFDEQQQNTDAEERRFVEITVSMHCLRGLSNLLQSLDDPATAPSLTLPLQEMQARRDKVVVCNCRFIREFTKRQQEKSEWVINVINYFNMSQLE